MICVALHPIDQCSNNFGRLDLTKVLVLLKVPQERLILSVVLFDCIIILLPNALVGWHHRCELQSIPD
jgi:hypothetical protein